MAGGGFSGGGMSNTLEHEKQFTMQGHTLHRTSPTDGPVSYMAERWGMARYLPTLDDADKFLIQVGGTAV